MCRSAKEKGVVDEGEREREREREEREREREREETQREDTEGRYVRNVLL